MVSGAPRLLLRLEALGILLACLAAYHGLGASWWLFALLILAPDLGMAGYLAGARAGAIGYNATHTYLAPLVLGAAGLLWAVLPAQALALIWAAHIAGDRALGFGLKYPDRFGLTHLGLSSAGKRAASAAQNGDRAARPD
ncbi:DUF4260 domain-containing protein [Ancylobacter sp. 6x-1]|uniref:DUF4260 domain-containing protein n=2 Tax=Ancylobacter crimeensis TaxID=2579147 RepID=A0ABT0DEC3_9HYPH|nr:DUF4260 domain-containing protein [Ancylobacter crimeensis]MCK0198315.1 DUF4260 domain-containing protein [Ancylobacter crimeensis]